MKIEKWWRRLVARLVAVVVRMLGPKPGDDVPLADTRRLTIDREATRAEVLKRLRAFRGRLPPDFRFDRDEANAR